MAGSIWAAAVETLAPHVVRISTPRGFGTGFLISNGKNNSICGIATAAHVVDHAHFWEEPIRIDHLSSEESVVLRRGDRAILLDRTRDTAAILFDRGDIPLPADPLPLAPKDKFLKVGSAIGWLGFPAVPSAGMSFFRGYISSWVSDNMAYLVDGVAINGVSGGPAFHTVEEVPDTVFLIGVVSAYMPNRATGEVLPGLSVVQDVSQFHELTPTFASLDQAQDAQQAMEPPQPLEECGPNPTRASRPI